jgi:hypothetical protein
MTAHRITRFMFVAGGALFPSPAAVPASFLGRDRGLSPALAMALLEASSLLSSGASDARQFCASAAESCGAQGEAAARLYECFAGGVAALPGMPEMVRELAATSEIFLASDYPPEWLLPALSHSGLAPYCPEDGVVYTAGLGGYSGLFARLVEAGAIVPGHTIWVDSHSRRTSEALRKGIDAAIFVDAPRLRRDLGLWGLLPR